MFLVISRGILWTECVYVFVVEMQVCIGAYELAVFFMIVISP
jgi:hypothetical protein